MKMPNHQCYRLARTLSPDEWRQFIDNISRLRQKKLQDLRTLVIAMKPMFPEFQMSDEALWASAFPGVSYDNARLRILRNYLKVQLHRFLCQQELQEDVATQQLLLIRALQRRGCLDQAAALLQSEQERLARAPLSTDQLDREMVLEEINLDLFVKIQNRKGNYPWEQVLDKMAALATTKQLRLLCAMMSARGFQLSKEGAKEYPLQELLETVSWQIDNLPLLGKIYYHLLKLFIVGGQESTRQQIQESMATFGDTIDATERMNVHGLMINYFLQQGRNGDIDSLHRALQTYKEMDRNGLLMDAGQFTVSHVKNAVALSARLGEITWAREFLERMREHIASSEGENLYLYSAAYLDFAERKYSDAKRRLSQFDFLDPFYKVSHDGLLLRIGFETHDPDLFYTIHATLNRHTYRQSTISPSFRKSIQNLLKIILPLYDLRWNPQPKTSLPQLRTLLASFKTIANLDWVHAKLHELEALQPKSHE
jgi:hypothetical protein